MAQRRYCPLVPAQLVLPDRRRTKPREKMHRMSVWSKQWGYGRFVPFFPLVSFCGIVLCLIQFENGQIEVFFSGEEITAWDTEEGKGGGSKASALWPGERTRGPCGAEGRSYRIAATQIASLCHQGFTFEDQQEGNLSRWPFSSFPTSQSKLLA